MDAGAVAGKREPVFKGGENGGKAENPLESFLKTEREFWVVQGVRGQLVCNAGMLVGKFLSYARLFRRLSIFILREKVLFVSPLGGFVLCPETVHQVEIRAQWWEGACGRASQDSRQAVGIQLLDPGGQADEAENYHKDKGADDLGLVLAGLPIGE